jgi:hypothetical protein
MANSNARHSNYGGVGHHLPSLRNNGGNNGVSGISPRVISPRGVHRSVALPSLSNQGGSSNGLNMGGGDSEYAADRRAGRQQQQQQQQQSGVGDALPSERGGNSLGKFTDWSGGVVFRGDADGNMNGGGVGGSMGGGSIRGTMRKSNISALVEQNSNSGAAGIGVGGFRFRANQQQQQQQQQLQQQMPQQQSNSIGAAAKQLAAASAALTSGDAYTEALSPRRAGGGGGGGGGGGMGLGRATKTHFLQPQNAKYPTAPVSLLVANAQAPGRGARQ